MTTMLELIVWSVLAYLVGLLLWRSRRARQWGWLGYFMAMREIDEQCRAVQGHCSPEEIAKWREGWRQTALDYYGVRRK